MAATATGDTKTETGHKPGERLFLQLLSEAATTSDNNVWRNVAGARDIVFYIRGLPLTSSDTVTSVDVRIRAHPSRIRPGTSDAGIDIFGPATQDAIRYVAGPIEWIRADLVRVTSVDQWDSATSVDVFVNGVF